MSTSSHEIVIAPGQSKSNYLKDLWRYRELLIFMAWREILIRYKQMTLGIAWAVVRPIMTAAIFTLVFHKIARLNYSEIPYTLLVFSAILPWQFFSASFSDSGTCLSNKENLITKIYFPRMIIPASVILVNIFDLMISTGIVISMIAYHKIPFDIRMLATLPLMLHTAVLALGSGLLISALSAKFKDVRHIVPFIVQIGLYASPVGYSSTEIPQEYEPFFSLNPMVGIIDGFRWSLLGIETSETWQHICTSLTVSSIILLLGILYFRRLERSFAEIL